MPVRSNIEKFVEVKKIGDEQLKNKKARIKTHSGSIKERLGGVPLKFKEEQARARDRVEENIRRISHEREGVRRKLPRRCSAPDRRVR